MQVIDVLVNTTLVAHSLGTAAKALQYYIAVEELRPSEESTPYSDYHIMLYAKNISEANTMPVTTYSVHTWSASPTATGTSEYEEDNWNAYDTIIKPQDFVLIAGWSLGLPNNGLRCNVRVHVKNVEYGLDFDVEASFNTSSYYSTPVSNCVCTADFTKSILNISWDPVETATHYNVTVYHKSSKGLTKVLIKQTVDSSLSFTLDDYSFWTALKPGDVLYAGVTSLSSDTNATEVFSNEVIYGDSAYCKMSDALWTNSITHVKTFNRFRPVKKVWIKVNGVWICAVDN